MGSPVFVFHFYFFWLKMICIQTTVWTLTVIFDTVHFLEEASFTVSKHFHGQLQELYYTKRFVNLY